MWCWWVGNWGKTQKSQIELAYCGDWKGEFGERDIKIG